MASCAQRWTSSQVGTTHANVSSSILLRTLCIPVSHFDLLLSGLNCQELKGRFVVVVLLLSLTWCCVCWPGEKVAIKKITNVFDHVSDATRILREIKLLRLLRHNGKQS